MSGIALRNTYPAKSNVAIPTAGGVKVISQRPFHDDQMVLRVLRD